MRDLVQRLRAMTTCVYLVADEVASADISWVLREAADEIERQNRMLETYRAECEGWQAALEKAERQRDESRALLLDIDQWFRQDGASFPDYIQARLDAALGGRDE